MNVVILNRLDDDDVVYVNIKNKHRITNIY
jgi:hypothetical protein